MSLSRFFHPNGDITFAHEEAKVIPLVMVFHASIIIENQSIAGNFKHSIMKILFKSIDV